MADKGVEIDEIDVTPFVEATAGVYDKLGYADLRKADRADPRPVETSGGPARNASRPVPVRRGYGTDAEFAGAFRSGVREAPPRRSSCFWSSRPAILRWFDHPLIWSVDLAQLLFLWVCLHRRQPGAQEARPYRHGPSRAAAAARPAPRWSRSRLRSITLAFLLIMVVMGYRLTMLNLAARLRRQRHQLRLRHRRRAGRLPASWRSRSPAISSISSATGGRRGASSSPIRCAAKWTTCCDAALAHLPRADAARGCRSPSPSASPASPSSSPTGRSRSRSACSRWRRPRRAFRCSPCRSSSSPAT